MELSSSISDEISRFRNEELYGLYIVFEILGRLKTIGSKERILYANGVTHVKEYLCLNNVNIKYYTNHIDSNNSNDNNDNSNDNRNNRDNSNTISLNSRLYCILAQISSIIAETLEYYHNMDSKLTYMRNLYTTNNIPECLVSFQKIILIKIEQLITKIYGKNITKKNVIKKINQ